MNRIGRSLLAGAIFSLAACIVYAGDSLAVTLPDDITLTAPAPNTVIAESDDYATQLLNDPWDMSNIEDVDQPYDVTNYGVNNGIWTGTTTGANSASVWFQYQNFPNSYSYLGEKDGVNYPIDQNRFTRLWVRMNTQMSGNSLLWFFRHYDYTGAGNSNFINAQQGWKIYSVDLRDNTSGGSGTWTQNGPYEGLRFDLPWSAPGNTVQIDWARLTPNTHQTVRIAWTHSGGGNANLYLSLSPNATEGNEYAIATVPAANGAFSWNTTGMAPGQYYIHAELNGAWSSIGPLIVNQAPMVRIDAPGPLSGEEYSYAVASEGWDGNNPNQFDAVENVANLTFAPDAISGRPTTGDPAFYYLDRDTANAIDANKYHYYNVRFWLLPPAARPFSPFNAGTRLLWGSGQTIDTTEIILAPYNRWIPAAYDLRRIELDINRPSSWNGRKETFRFDPLEEDDAHGQPRLLPDGFRISSAHLTSDPVAGRMSTPSSGLVGTIIRWTPLLGNGTLDLYRQDPTDRRAAVIIANDVPMNQGQYLWDTSNVPPGTYEVYAEASDGTNSTRNYALAPIVVDPSRPATLFNDVPGNLWAVDFINRLARLNIIGGTPQADTTVLFRPNNTATRAQLSKMVVLAAGWPLLNPPTPTYNDVTYGSTFYQYVETATSHGVSSGYACGGPNEPCPGRYFRPGYNVTRAQTAKMVAVSRGWPIISPTNNTFADVPYDPAPGSLYSYIETMYSRGIIGGYACGGAGEPCDPNNRPYFRPGLNVTRAQLSKMISLSLDSP